MRSLRPHQSHALDRLLRSVASGKRRPVVQLPTGAGKTILAGEIIRRARAKGNRALFVVPALSLIDQTVESFWRDDIREIGVIQADHPMTNPDRPVQIASVQSLIRRPKPDVKLVIVDECHVMNRAFLEWLADPSMRDVIVVGLSATPWAQGMGKHYDDLIICSTIRDLIEAKYLSPFRVFAPAHPDLTGVGTVAGDFQKGQLEAAMNKSVLVADIVSTWFRMGEGRPTLAFGVDRAHAKHIQAQFEASGIPCGYVDAYTTMDERKVVRDKFHRGEYKIVSNVGCLTTGTDWDVRCIIDARPTKSEILLTQIYGRGLRIAEGKDDLIILDHADNYTRHGFVTDIFHDKLDDGTPKPPKKRSQPLPKECPKCSYLRPPKLAQCPNCGFKAEAGPSTVETAEGSLSEVVRGTGSKATAPKGHVRIGKAVIHLADFYGMLKKRCRERNYREGWAANQYKEAVGTWPNKYRDVPEKPVSWEVDCWLKANLIRHAHARKTQKQPAGEAHAGT
ncbi:DEAD/DEAH box helicase [Azospirillum sp. SYSU D00513]|uniref:DEAD/DEAH box helicase n=1 Tax=Azospirillum sp. SYSU D00513 TaxID=2812561 RepID=UPI001FFF245E|nr:DEAD/DEAH box helicase [Azospirillum sp. SYSU D00513]